MVAFPISCIVTQNRILSGRLDATLLAAQSLVRVTRSLKEKLGMNQIEESLMF